jgi:hypothetical protein
VSPLWRDEVAIYIAPRKIALARRTRGVKPRLGSATEVVVAGHFGDCAPTLARLADVLTEPTWQDAVARVIVADPWARYGIVPWPNLRLDNDGRLSHARYVLAESYGEAVSDWNVSLADTPPGRAYVACAMPASLKSGLEEVLAGARLKLGSLQPQLIVSFNAWRHQLPPDNAWFVSLDEGSLAAVHLSQGAWDRVHMARLSQDWAIELERLRTFGRLSRSGGESSRMLVDAPLWMRQTQAARATSDDFEWLESDGSQEAGRGELALLQRVYA